LLELERIAERFHVRAPPKLVPESNDSKSEVDQREQQRWLWRRCAARGRC
jgi:hypothetical protein